MKSKCDRCYSEGVKLYLLPFMNEQKEFLAIEICKKCSMEFHELLNTVSNDFMKEHKGWTDENNSD